MRFENRRFRLAVKERFAYATRQARKRRDASAQYDDDAARVAAVHCCSRTGFSQRAITI